MEWDLILDADVQGQMIAFVRINRDIPESFTVALRYQPEKGAPIVLTRVNGDHGGHMNPDGSRFEGGAHVHFPTEGEMDLPAIPGMWVEGPPSTIHLGVYVIPLAEAWRMLVERTNIAAGEEASRDILRISALVDQLNMGF